jgi:hypothetical protein
MPCIVLGVVSEVQGDDAEDLPVPMALGILIERSKHNRKNYLNIVADKVAEILIVPEVQSSFCDLEMRARD